MQQGILRGMLAFAVLLAAVIVGSLIAEFSSSTTSLAWLGKAFDVGISTFSLDLKIFIITLGFQMHITVAEILMILVGIICYPKVANLIFS